MFPPASWLGYDFCLTNWVKTSVWSQNVITVIHSWSHLCQGLGSWDKKQGESHIYNRLWILPKLFLPFSFYKCNISITWVAATPEHQRPELSLRRKSLFIIELIWFYLSKLTSNKTKNKKILNYLSHMKAALIPVCSALMLPSKLDEVVDEVSSAPPIGWPLTSSGQNCHLTPSLSRPLCTKLVESGLILSPLTPTSVRKTQSSPL